MKRQGSVLVVVLGLLAVLAVIGVAFLTMSSLERSTAASFALQTQLMHAADGALDYAIHQMVADVWEWNIPEPNKFEFTGRLLTGRQAGVDPADGKTYAACEPYDYPGADDPWLSGNITGNNTPNPLSFAGPVVKRFGINFGGTTAVVDNLGFPVAAANRKANGIWIPDLAVPCDQYLIRASLTILDHNALLNLNAHGNVKDTTTWEYSDCTGKGYFISDAVPPLANLDDLLFGTGSVPGCWGSGGPGNAKAGAVLIENPVAGSDVPFTLDEEFELRNLGGTYFKSRLEQIWLLLDTNPGDFPNPASAYEARLKTTTVSGTAEVFGDATPSQQQPNPPHKTALGGWSAPKVDLNTASAEDIYKALLDARAWDDDAASKAKLRQFVANIRTFREKRTSITSPFFPIIEGIEYLGAVRQPVLGEVTCSPPVVEEIDEDEDGVVDLIIRTYTLQVEVYNPWNGDYDGDPDGRLTHQGQRVTFDLVDNGAVHKVYKPPVPIPRPSTSNFTETLGTTSSPQYTAAGDSCLTSTIGTKTVPYVERQVVCFNATLKDALKSIRLHWLSGTYKGKWVNLDLIDGPNIATLETAGRIYRKVDYTDEYRSTATPVKGTPIRVFYVSDWNSGGSANLGTVTPTGPNKDPGLQSSAIPIRFPHSVSEPPPKDLPVRAAGADFKAFARLGDLNQVLRITPGAGDSWWSEPWVVTASKAPRTQESDVKFDWMKDINNVVAGTGTAAAYAANVLSVGGPWNDGLDNDGDGKTDADDTGKTGAGLAGGPEFRVAGKINLNTAIPEALNALGLASLPAKPIKSPVQVLSSSATSNGIEQRDATFTRISNIATVRSDTFSVYGTVQLVDPAAKDSSGNLPDSAVIRSRRFWALVDRSPSLAYPPTDKTNFIYPRVLNFQWLD